MWPAIPHGIATVAVKFGVTATAMRLTVNAVDGIIVSVTGSAGIGSPIVATMMTISVTWMVTSPTVRKV